MKTLLLAFAVALLGTGCASMKNRGPIACEVDGTPLTAYRISIVVNDDGTKDYKSTRLCKLCGRTFTVRTPVSP